jgi:hypothetical protein
MDKMRLIAAWCVLLGWSVCVHSAEPNAGDVYLKAMGMAAKWDKDAERISSWDELPLDEAKKLAIQGKEALELLSAATKLKECDWKVDTAGPKDVDMSFLSGAKLLCQMGELQARIDLEERKTADGMDRLCELMVMGRRLREIPIAVARFIGGGCELSAINEAAMYLPDIHAGEARKLLKLVEEKPKTPSRESVVEAEARVTPLADQKELGGLAERLKPQDGWINSTRAMFAAALAERIEGEEALRSAKDPAGGQPFGIRKFEGGYELSSKALWKGKPVTLVVGKEKAGK